MTSILYSPIQSVIPEILKHSDAHAKSRDSVKPIIKSDGDDRLLPPGAWDSHVHVVDEDRFPLHPHHPFRPKRATVTDLQGFHKSHGIEHACLVAFSVYHTDNRSLLDALGRLNGRGRGVACIDPYQVTDDELQQLHSAGVRAVRVNMKTRGAELDLPLLQATADRVRPYSWAVQIYISLRQVVDLAPVVPKLQVPIIIDHIGAPDPNLGPARQQPGSREFIHLLRTENVWTKLSGTYRFQNLPDLDDYICEILQVAPDRVVWASDWPHSGGRERNPGGDRTKVQQYRQVDDLAFIYKCKTLCKRVGGGDGGDLVQKIWVDNPRALWQYNSDN